MGPWGGSGGSGGGGGGGGGGGSVSAEWAPAMYSFLKSQNAALDQYTELKLTRNAAITDTWRDFNQFVASGGTVSPAGTSRGGLLTLNTGAVIGSSALVNPIGQPSLIINPKTEPWAVAGRIACNTAIDATYHLRVGLTTTTPSDQIGIEIDGTISTAFWELFQYKSGPISRQLTTQAVPSIAPFLDVAVWFDTVVQACAFGDLFGAGMNVAAATITNHVNMPTAAMMFYMYLLTDSAAIRSVSINRLLCAYTNP